MHSALAEILLEKRREVERIKKNRLPGEGVKNILPVRNFKDVISAPGRINLIAEIKFASPSAGTIQKKNRPRLNRPGIPKSGSGRFVTHNGQAVFQRRSRAIAAS
jgi:hypothetical protein